MRKAGCDGIVCTSRFDAHFLSHELLNPGIQEVVEELTSNLHGQQIYVTRYEAADGTSYERLSALCRERGHLLIGIQNGDGIELNVSPDHRVERGDRAITIGQRRLASLPG